MRSIELLGWTHEVRVRRVEFNADVLGSHDVDYYLPFVDITLHSPIYTSFPLLESFRFGVVGNMITASIEDTLTSEANND